MWEFILIKGQNEVLSNAYKKCGFSPRFLHKETTEVDILILLSNSLVIFLIGLNVVIIISIISENLCLFSQSCSIDKNGNLFIGNFSRTDCDSDLERERTVSPEKRHWKLF